MNMEIGRVIGTEKRPNTAYTFFFWTAVAAKVGIGTLVKVQTETSAVYGVVVEAEGFNDLESPLHEFLSVGGNADQIPPTLRPEMRVFEAAVLRRDPEEPIGAVPIGPVFLADERDVQVALRTDSYAEQYGIPCGVYGDKDGYVPVHLDHRYLLGPESGHINVTGTSGLASKTSFILFLLSSIFQKYQDVPNEEGHKGVAALLFNTKGGDLLYLDHSHEEGVEQLSEGDLAIYQATGIRPEPFQSVRYFAPYATDGKSLNTRRRNKILDERNPTRPITFGLAEILKHAEVLLNRDDLDAKADGYLQYLAEMVRNEESVTFGTHSGPIETLDDLNAFVKFQLRQADEGGKNQIGSHSAFTARKMSNRLSTLTNRFKGLIASKGQGTGPFVQAFQPNTVYVVDVAGLNSQEQNLVFAAVVSQLRERMENGNLGVARMVAMIDELNKYAPSGGAETYVVQSLKEISSRGRYMGLTLFGAQQFRSRVDKEIVGNAATHVFGHVEAEELAQPGYSYFSPSVKEKLGALPQGQVLVKHPHFAQPIFLRFPRPACLKGQDGMRRYLLTEVESVKATIQRRLLAFPAAYLTESRAILTGLTNDEELLQDTLHRLNALKEDQDPRPILRRGKKGLEEPEGIRMPNSADKDDPFA